MKKTTIILDSHEYKSKEEIFKNALSHITESNFFYSEYDNWVTNFFAKTPFLNSLLLHLSYWTLSLLYTLKLLFSSRKDDTKIFINPIVGFFYSLISRLIGSRPSIVIAGFLFEEKNSKFYYNLRKFLVLFSYKYVAKIIVYSDVEERKYRYIFPTLGEKFQYVPYGKDYDYNDKKEFNAESEYLSSGGRSNRDYQTLCRAMNIVGEKNSPIKLLIATRPECFNSLNTFSNVQFLYGVTLNQFGSFLNNSKFVILPLIDSDLSAGHMTLFEALSLKKLVLVADIPSVRDYVSENEVVFYKPGDPEDLANKIIRLYSGFEHEKYQAIANNGYELYVKKYSFKSLLIRIVDSVN